MNLLCSQIVWWRGLSLLYLLHFHKINVGSNNGFQEHRIMSTNCFLSGKMWKSLKDARGKNLSSPPPTKTPFSRWKEYFLRNSLLLSENGEEKAKKCQKNCLSWDPKTICSSQSKVSLNSESTRKFEDIIQSKIPTKIKIMTVMSEMSLKWCHWFWPSPVPAPAPESLCCLFIHPHCFPALEFLLVLSPLLALPCFENPKNDLSALGSQENPLEWGHSSLQESVCPNPDISSSTMPFNKSGTLVPLSQLDLTPDILMTKFHWV